MYGVIKSDYNWVKHCKPMCIQIYEIDFESYLKCIYELEYKQTVMTMTQEAFRERRHLRVSDNGSKITKPDSHSYGLVQC